MTYPPANPGYPAPQQGYGGPPPAPPRGSVPTQTPAGTGQAPTAFTGAVVGLGLLAYLLSFGPIWNGEFTPGPGIWQAAALLAALLAAIGLLPKSNKSYTPIVAVSAVLALLLLVFDFLNPLGDATTGWALWLVLLVILLQAGVAVAALLFETGVLTAPAPRPRYNSYGQYGDSHGQYGPLPGGYYGQPGQGRPPAPGYPPQYPVGYGAVPVGGYGQDNTDTPPTGFPSYSATSGAESQPPSASTPSSESPSGSGAAGPSQP